MATQIAPVDTSIALPAAVRAQSEAADQLHKQIYQTSVEDAAPPAVEPPTPVAPASVPESAVGPVTQQVTQEEPPARSPVVENGSWEQRYWSMFGRAQAAESSLSVERENNAALRGMLATLQAAPSETTQPQIQPTVAANLVTEQERQEFGAELLDVVGRRAQEAVAQQFQSMNSELQDLRQRVNTTNQQQVRTSREQLLVFLDRNLPDWRTINKKSEFKAWLALHDTLSGAKRQDMLMEAFEANDSPRVLAFFNGFLNGAAPAAPSSEPAPQAATPPAKPTLEALAAPGRAKTTAAPNAPVVEKPTYTQAQITRFYADSAAGRYRGREAEKDAIEQDIFLAQKEGRIRA